MAIKRPLVLAEGANLDELDVQDAIMAEFSRELILSSMQFRIPDGHQYLVYNQITVDGTVILDGKLVVI